jgi:tetratricopeptide (TPR) repeat protein
MWHGLAESKLRTGETTVATQIYENAITHYESAIKEYANELLWNPTRVRLETGRFEVFHKDELPRHALWAVLGEAYKAKGDREKANSAFRHALEIKPYDQWLQRIVREGATLRGDDVQNEAISAEIDSNAERVEESQTWRRPSCTHQR